ncbi:unnamed protein product [Allacma fusca]|uniref:DUF229 domain containing protein n=1 Tax=Allacma fusca TaxID=39272 RepID=A0A8J2NTP3_9HEXA|nr:unnamed protein product [Allacma fusca]
MTRHSSTELSKTQKFPFDTFDMFDTEHCVEAGGPVLSAFEFTYKIDDSSIRKYYYRGVKNHNETTACRIPRTPAVPKFFNHNWKPSLQDCSYELQLAVLQNDTNLRFLPNIPTPCCLQEIIRGGNDQEFGLTKCDYVERNVNIGAKEAFLITCEDFINAEASIPIKPKVQEKMKYWEKVPLDGRSPSVLLFGIDSTSRAHAYRSLPQSIDLMMKLGFVDFNSYHSVAPATLNNFMAFLMGLTRNEVRNSCAPNWTTPFDECPLIWKTFSEQKYVTSYIEDGSQTFNWGGQSGFNEAPTDYYLHHFFKQLRESRDKLLSSWWLTCQDCTSTESIPEFVLRYTMRFLKKFSKIPFFSFVWMSNPFHDDEYALLTLDQKLVKLFELISVNEDLLQNLVIMILSDHGNRYGSFSSSESPEGFFERGLPPLFIRLPDRLRNEHPEILRTLKSNSEKLTTPFDIHQTLFHILSLSPNYMPESVNYNLRADRCSLFSDYPINRTCSNTNIPPAHCLCNAHFNQFEERSTKVEKQFTSKLLAFAVKSLNDKIQASKYRRNCSEWTVSWSNAVIFHRIISENDQFVDSVIAFDTKIGEAKFEARIHTPQGKDGIIVASSKIIGFSRISKYGHQSWCVRGKTDEDKMMKEICYCI